MASISFSRGRRRRRPSCFGASFRNWFRRDYPYVPARFDWWRPHEVKLSHDAQTERPDPQAEFAADVQAGLLRKGQKQLPPKYFYDAVGSALFEAITAFPEYGLTRADERVLSQNAGAIAERSRALPAWSSNWEADRAERPERCWPPCAARDCATAPSMSPRTALAQCTRELDALANVLPVESGFLEGLAESLRWRRPGERALRPVPWQHDRQLPRRPRPLSSCTACGHSYSGAMRS